MIILTDANFDEEVVFSKTLVVVTAPWCPHCVKLWPVIDELDKDIGACIKVCKLNSDENKATTKKLRVTSIPTILVYVFGEEKDRQSGFKTKEAIMQMLDAV